ncbi:TKL protein kinase [Phytophthora nicotianae]|nr:TKL protein kinase [Phytophthora nicotianae]
MDGGDLRGLLTSYHNQHHPVGFNCAKVKIALHIAHALTYLHSLSPVVIHRDLKSRNILLTTDLDAKLTDFGVSRERADHTMTAGVGTSLWMAPEVLMGERYDDKADIFSFGVVLSELDLQVLPYAHATESDGSCHRMRDLAILQRMAMGKLRVQFSRNALASMVDVGVACVSLDPKDRPTAAEVLYRLQTIQRDELLSV